MKHTEYGIQMYSLRDITEKSMQQTLESVAKMGFKYIEFAGFFGHTAEQIKSWLNEYKLVCSGAHVGLDDLLCDNIESTINYYKKIGCKNIIVPCCDWSTVEKTQNIINILNDAQKKLAEADIRLGYHNHSMEFVPSDDGIIFQNELIEKTKLELEIDIFWLYNTGLDVIGYLEKYKERIKVIHIKDGEPCHVENRNFNKIHSGVKEFSLGQGSVPVTEVIDWAIANDVLMVVESEGLNPTGLEEVKRCMGFLQSL